MNNCPICTTQIEKHESTRCLDVWLAEVGFGYHVERLHPQFYKHEVFCFYEVGCSLIQYSYDENACNAMMYRNGVDASEGTAPPLPYFVGEDSDDTTFWLQITRLIESQKLQRFRVDYDGGINKLWVAVVDVGNGGYQRRATERNLAIARALIVASAKAK